MDYKPWWSPNSKNLHWSQHHPTVGRQWPCRPVHWPVQSTIQPKPKLHNGDNTMVTGLQTTGPPDYRTTDYRTTDYRTTDYRTPDYRTPDYRTPDYRTPDYRTPDYRTPDYRTPDYRTPDYRTPDYRTPDYRQTGRNRLRHQIDRLGD